VYLQHKVWQKEGPCWSHSQLWFKCHNTFSLFSPVNINRIDKKMGYRRRVAWLHGMRFLRINGAKQFNSCYSVKNLRLVASLQQWCSSRNLPPRNAAQLPNTEEKMMKIIVFTGENNFMGLNLVRKREMPDTYDAIHFACSCAIWNKQINTFACAYMYARTHAHTHTHTHTNISVCIAHGQKSNPSSVVRFPSHYNCSLKLFKISFCYTDTVILLHLSKSTCPEPIVFKE
jgi:hypothetical protein